MVRTLAAQASDLNVHVGSQLLPFFSPLHIYIYIYITSLDTCIITVSNFLLYHVYGLMLLCSQVCMRGLVHIFKHLRLMEKYGNDPALFCAVSTPVHHTDIHVLTHTVCTCMLKLGSLLLHRAAMRV